MKGKRRTPMQKMKQKEYNAKSYQKAKDEKESLKQQMVAFGKQAEENDRLAQQWHAEQKHIKEIEL